MQGIAPVPAIASLAKYAFICPKVTYFDTIFNLSNMQRIASAPADTALSKYALI